MLSRTFFTFLTSRHCVCVSEPLAVHAFGVSIENFEHNKILQSNAKPIFLISNATDLWQLPYRYVMCVGKQL